MMHHPGPEFYSRQDFRNRKKLVFNLNYKKMKKKILFSTMLGISVMALAQVQAVWTSTCGVRHYTTFPDNYTYNQMANTIADINYGECGTRPNVTINP
jgi:hypothetical protein